MYRKDILYLFCFKQYAPSATWKVADFVLRAKNNGKRYICLLGGLQHHFSISISASFPHVASPNLALQRSPWDALGNQPAPTKQNFLTKGLGLQGWTSGWDSTIRDLTLVKPGASQESSDCGSLEEPLAQRLCCWALSVQALTWHPESSYMIPPRGANTASGF